MKHNYKKVPVILQMEALECGAASLAMVLAYYKKYVPLEKLRVDCNVSRDGSTAKYILLAAQHHGLTAKGYRMSIEKLKKHTDFPMVIHWNFNHFVVLCGFKNDKAVLNDPAGGTVEVDMDAFDRSFTGVVLTFEPGEGFQPEGKPKSVLSFLVKRLNGAVSVLVFILTMGFILAVLQTIKPIFYKIFTDDILIGSSSEWMGPLVGGMLMVLVVCFIVEGLRSNFLAKLKAKMSVSASSMFMWHVLRLPVEFFSQRFAGDISARQSSNNTIANTLCGTLAPVILNVVMIGLYFILMLYYDVTMSLIGLGMVIINILLMRSVSKHNQNASKNIQRDSGRLSGIMISGVSMIETIKASGAEFGFFEKISGYQTKYNNAMLSMRKRNTYINLAPQILSGACNGLILILGVYNIFDGKFTVGSLMAFQGFMSLFLGPVGSLVDSLQAFQDMSGSMERVEDVMNYKTDVSVDFINQANTYDKLTGKVDLDAVSFGYSSLVEPLIKDFSLHTEKGNMIALVGGSGSGKSTIAKVISGLYPPRSGDVLFDGTSLKELDRYVLTNSLAVVDQSISLFSGTIRDNISMWDNTMNEETMIQACKDACIHDDIMTRKEGYDFMISEGGANFSGGQRQRLEIARAFAAEPSILILDEATSALDPATEKEIMDAVKRRKITCFVIAHRLSTIRDADEIILLEYGREVERGTHEQLISLNGKYASLVRSE